MIITSFLVTSFCSRSLGNSQHAFDKYMMQLQNLIAQVQFKAEAAGASVATDPRYQLHLISDRERMAAR